MKDRYAGRIGEILGMKNPLPKDDYENAGKLSALEDLDNFFEDANRRFISREKRKYHNFFGRFDESQAEAIIRDDDQILVLAGAGSGKTKTIEGKVNYLVERKGIAPSDILLISFTNATVTDLNSRDLKNVKAKTFHKIGNSIIKAVSTENISILDPESGKKGRIINDFLKEPSLDPRQLNEIADYFMYEIIPPERDETDDRYELIENNTGRNGFLAYRSLLMSGGTVGLTGQRFKSKEEARIANFFTVHGIEFEYEKPYRYQERDGIHNAYKPDFYLPGYGIYLEHFGITRDRQVPFTRGRKDSAEQTRRYLDGIDWKRQTHKKHGTVLLETYSYYFTENVIYDRLREMLESHGVAVHEPDAGSLLAVYQKIMSIKNLPLDSFSRLLVTFITQYKSTGMCDDPRGFAALYKANELNPPYRRERTARFLSVAEKAYAYYQEKLAENNEIDFEDMINKACRFLQTRNGNEKLRQDYGKFKYIIIDEYQDISARRMELVRLIMEMSGAKLFCVGDDWQSIYRFSGSDLSNILRFEENYPDRRQLELANTYRNSQQLTDSASRFIQENPGQKKKTIRSAKNCVQPIQIVETYGEQLPYFLEVLNEVYRINPSGSLYVLGRYNRDLNNFGSLLHGKYGQHCMITRRQMNIDVVKIDDYPGLEIRFSTVHRSKGLESDNIIVLNLSGDKRGFPSKIESDPVLNLVLPMKDLYPFEEERRLFYVALTRTRNKVYLLTDGDQPSEFVSEIKNYPNVVLRRDITTGIQRPPTCPKCFRSLVLKQMPGRAPFWVCPGYPECSYIMDSVDKEIEKNRCRCINPPVNTPFRKGMLYGWKYITGGYAACHESGAEWSAGKDAFLMHFQIIS